MRRHFPATFYASADGRIFTARQTDQAGSREQHNRTRHGAPVEMVRGVWYAVQMKFQPFKRAAAEAAAAADARNSKEIER